MNSHPALPEKIHHDVLVLLTGVSDRQLRKLASKGILPPFEKSQWQTVPTLQAIIEYYRSSSTTTTAALEEKIQTEQLENWRLKNAKLKKSQVSRLVVDHVWGTEVTAAVSALLTIPRSLAAEIGQDAADKVEKKIRDALEIISKNPDYDGGPEIEEDADEDDEDTTPEAP